MINWFDMPDEGLSNGGQFEVKELEVTENGTYETKGEMYNKVVVNVEGGGGSSDFSTAKVDIYFIFDGEPIVLDSADIAYLIKYPLDTESTNNQYYVSYPLNNGASETHPILYKGECKCNEASGKKGSNFYVIGGEAPTVTGNIEFAYETGITIKGDGSITFYLVQD